MTVGGNARIVRKGYNPHPWFIWAVGLHGNFMYLTIRRNDVAKRKLVAPKKRGPTDIVKVTYSRDRHRWIEDRGWRAANALGIPLDRFLLLAKRVSDANLDDVFDRTGDTKI